MFMNELSPAAGSTHVNSPSRSITRPDSTLTTDAKISTIPSTSA